MDYINNYIDWDQFNQLYDSDRIEKDIRNTDAVIRKLRSILIYTTNYRLEVAREEKRKKEDMIEKRKSKVMVAKC